MTIFLGLGCSTRGPNGGPRVSRPPKIGGLFSATNNDPASTVVPNDHFPPFPPRGAWLVDDACLAPYCTLLQIRHDGIVVFECGLKGRVPLISESGFATVDLGAVKDASIGACSRGCMVIHGGVCCHAIAFSLAAKKNIMDYINPRDTTVYWRSQYGGVFKIPTSQEYATHLNSEPNLRPVPKWKAVKTLLVYD